MDVRVLPLLLGRVLSQQLECQMLPPLDLETCTKPSTQASSPDENGFDGVNSTLEFVGEKAFFIIIII